jgi:hypothetical protein
VPFPIDLFTSGSVALVGLVITAACIVLIPDWRLALLALTIQYVLLGLLLSNIVQSSVATVRVLSGGIAAAIVFLSIEYRAAQDYVSRRTRDKVVSQSLPVFVIGVAFRFFAVVLVAVSLIGFASSMTFLGLPAYVLFGSMWLMAIGLLIAMLSRDVLRLGMGILAFTGGFGILDTAIEGSLFLYGLINIADLLIAVVVSHLATLSSEQDSPRRGDTL